MGGVAANNLSLAPVYPLPSAQQGWQPSDVVRNLMVATALGTPAFIETHLSAKAHEVVSLTFSNQSGPEFHYRDSWVLVYPGKPGDVALSADRSGPLRSFMPDSSHVIARTTRLLSSGESETIIFQTPSVPGDYPYISTYPGHSNVMKGIVPISK